MSGYLRPSLRVAGVAAAGAGAAYAGHHYLTTTSFFFTTAHAESLPSDSRAALKKMTWKGFTEERRIAMQREVVGLLLAQVGLC